MASSSTINGGCDEVDEGVDIIFFLRLPVMVLW